MPSRRTPKTELAVRSATSARRRSSCRRCGGSYRGNDPPARLRFGVAVRCHRLLKQSGSEWHYRSVAFCEGKGCRGHNGCGCRTLHILVRRHSRNRLIRKRNRQGMPRAQFLQACRTRQRNYVHLPRDPKAGSQALRDVVRAGTNRRRIAPRWNLQNPAEAKPASH